MKSLIHKSVSITMALLLLLTTTSFSIAAHFCGDHLVDIAFYDDARSCEMQDTDPEMHDAMKDMGCCKDKQIVSASDQDFQKTTFDFSLDQLVFITAFVHSYAVLLEQDLDTAQNRLIKESPPLPGRDLFLLHDSFLI